MVKSFSSQFLPPYLVVLQKPCDLCSDKHLSWLISSVLWHLCRYGNTQNHPSQRSRSSCHSLKAWSRKDSHWRTFTSSAVPRHCERQGSSRLSGCKLLVDHRCLFPLSHSTWGPNLRRLTQWECHSQHYSEMFQPLLACYELLLSHFLHP